MVKTDLADPCHDGIKNGNETDIDCGGGVCDRCADQSRSITTNGSNLVIGDEGSPGHPFARTDEHRAARLIATSRPRER